MNKKTAKLYKALRWGILLIILIWITAFGIMHQYLDRPKPPGVDAFCPFGGLESLITLLTSGAMIKRIVASSFVLLIATVLLALVSRRAFCGIICPLGTLQEIFGTIGKKIFKKPFTVHQGVDKYARYLKYVALVLIIAFSVKTGELIIRPYDPWPAYMHLTSNEVFAEFLVGFIILVLSMIGSFFYSRVFCKYLCPMGAFLGLISKIGWFRVTRNSNSCIDCKACTKICPVNIPVHEQNSVTTAECLSCNLCITKCPVESTLYLAGPAQSKMPLFISLLVTVLVFSAVITTATVMDKFEWVQKSLTQEIHESGHFDPEIIKGRMTFKEISEASGIPADLFMSHFGITQMEFTQAIKEVHENHDFETEDVREFVIENMPSK